MTFDASNIKLVNTKIGKHLLNTVKELNFFFNNQTPTAHIIGVFQVLLEAGALHHPFKDLQSHKYRHLSNGTQWE